MCKAHSKVTHVKLRKYFHHLKGRGYNKDSLKVWRRGGSPGSAPSHQISALWVKTCP